MTSEGPTERDKKNQEIAALAIKEKKELSIRLTLAQAMAHMLTEAFDALLHYNINYRTLPTYQNTQPLDDARHMPVEDAEVVILGWIERMASDIRAAIRRKQMRPVPK